MAGPSSRALVFASKNECFKCRAPRPGGGGETFSVKWDVDYGSNYASKVFSFPASASGEYGVDEYTVAEYSVGAVINRKNLTLSKTGRVFQLGVEASIDGSPLSIQQIDIFVKGGRTV